MKINVSIPDYDGNALDVIWAPEARYSVRAEDAQVVLKANQAGLISLAKQMLYMAYNDLPGGSHVHLDEFFTDSPCGNALVIELDADSI